MICVKIFLLVSNIIKMLLYFLFFIFSYLVFISCNTLEYHFSPFEGDTITLKEDNSSVLIYYSQIEDTGESSFWFRLIEGNAEKVIMNLYEDLSKIDEPLQTFNLTQNGQYQFMTTYDKVSIFNLFSSTPITFSLIFSNIEAIIPITRNVSEYILPKKKGFYYFQFERYFFEESVFSVNDYYSLEFVDLETEKRSYCFYFPCILDTLILTNRSYKLILESRDEEEERIMVYSQNLQKFSDIKENETITVTDEWKIKQLLYYKLDISNYQVGYENLMKFVELNYWRDNVFVSFHCSVVSANDTSYSGIVSNYKEGNNCKNVTDLFYPFDDGYSYFSFSKTKEEQNVFVIVIDIITYYKQYFSFFISPMIALDGSKDVIINKTCELNVYEFTFFQIHSKSLKNHLILDSNFQMSILDGKFYSKLSNYFNTPFVVRRGLPNKSFYFFRYNRFDIPRQVIIYALKTKEHIESVGDYYNYRSTYNVNFCHSPHYFVLSYSNTGIVNSVYGNLDFFSNTAIIENDKIRFPDANDEKQDGIVQENENVIAKMTCRHPGQALMTFNYYSEFDILSNGTYIFSNFYDNNFKYISFPSNAKGTFSFSLFSRTNCSAEIEIRSAEIEFHSVRIPLNSGETFLYPFYNLSEDYIYIYQKKYERDCFANITLHTIPNKDTYYKLKTFDEFVSFNPKKNNTYYIFNEKEINWTYIVVNVTNKENDIFSQFGYVNEEITNETVLIPKTQYVYQSSLKGQPENYIIITFINPLIYNENEKYKNYYFMLLSNSKLGNIEITKKKDFNIFGSSPAQKSLYYINNDELDSSFVIQNEKEKELLIVAKSCNQKKEESIVLNSIKQDILFVNETITNKYTFHELIFNTTIQFGFNIFREFDYSGALFSYLQNPSDTIKQTITDKLNSLELSQITFDRTTMKIKWDEISNSKYELFYTDFSEKYIELFSNECFFLEEAQTIQYKELNNNYYELKNLSSEFDYIINVIEIMKEPIELRLMHQPLLLSVRNNITFNTYPSIEQTTIDKTINALYIILPKEKYDYIECTISEPSYASYFQFKNIYDENYLFPPYKSNINYRDDKKGYTLVFSNPYKESDDIYYISFDFDKPIVDEPNNRFTVMYRYVNRSEQKEFENDNGVLYETDITQLVNGEYNINQGIKENYFNNITIFTKKSNEIEELLYKVYSSSVIINEFTVKSKYTSNSFLSTTDLGLKFETALQKNNSCFEMSYKVNATEEEIQNMNNALSHKCLNENCISFSTLNRTLNWTDFPNCELYEIYFLPYTEEREKNIDNDCYLIDIKHNTPNDVDFFIQNTTIVNFNKTGNYLIAIVAIINTDFPFRINYKYSNTTISIYDSITNFKKNVYHFNITVNKYIAIPFPKEYWESMTIKIDNPMYEYFLYYGQHTILEQIPIPEIEKERVYDHDMIFEFWNPDPYNRKPNVEYYIFIILIKENIKFNPSEKSAMIYLKYLIPFTEYSFAQDDKGIFYIDKVSKKEGNYHFKINNNISEYNDVTFRTLSCGSYYDFVIGKGYYSQKMNYILYSRYALFRIKATTNNYNGLIVSYGINLTEHELEIVDDLENRKKEIFFNAKHRLIEWNSIEECDHYEVYLFKGFLDNNVTSCFFIGKKHQKEKDFIYAEIKDNYYLFEGTGNYTIQIYGIVYKPMTLRLEYEIKRMNIPFYFIPDYKEENEIDIVNKNILIPSPIYLNNTHCKVSIKDPSFKYTLSFRKFKITKNSSYTFSYPIYYSFLGNVSIISFSNESLVESPTSNAFISYECGNVETPYKGIRDINMYYDSFPFSYWFNDVNDEYNNDITLLFKSCGYDKTLNVSSGLNHMLNNETISNVYHLYTVNTLTALIIEVSLLEENPKATTGFLFNSFRILSKQEKEQLILYSSINEKKEQIIFDYMKHTFYWKQYPQMKYTIFFINNADADITECTLLTDYYQYYYKQNVKFDNNFTSPFFIEDEISIAVLGEVSVSLKKMYFLFPLIRVPIYNIKSGEELPENKEITINEQHLIFMLPLDEWDFITIELLNVQSEQVKIGFLIFESVKKITFSTIEKEESNVVVFQKEENKNDYQYYISLKDIKSFKYTLSKKSNSKEEAIQFDKENYYHSGEKEFSLSNKININHKNEITFICRACSYSYNVSLSLNSGNMNQLNDNFTSQYSIKQFNTRTELIGKTNSEKDEGITFSFFANMTENDLSKVNQLIEKQKRNVPIYDKEKKIITWEKGDETSYEVYIVKKGKVKKYNDDCYLYRETHGKLRHLSEEGEIILKETNETQLEIELQNDQMVTIVGIIDGPVPMRILYPTLERSVINWVLIVIISILSVLLVVMCIILCKCYWRKKKNKTEKEMQKQLIVFSVNEVSSVNSNTSIIKHQ